MGGSFAYHDNEYLTYDDLYYKYSKLTEEHELGIKVDEFDCFPKKMAE